jgi:hypothetical protein
MEKPKEEIEFFHQLEKQIVDSGYYVDERNLENVNLHLYSIDSRYFELYYNAQKLVNIRELELEEISRFYSENIFAALNLFHKREKQASLN